MLFVLQQTDIGWASQINRKLEEYGLETSWDKIIKESRPKWKNAVLTATEKRNKEILIDMCYSKKGEKTKTRYVLEKLKSDCYERKPLSSFINRNKLMSRVLIMSMFGMLDCATNYKHGYGGENCRQCNVVDDESHRINDCIKYKEWNLFCSRYKYDFHTIFSNDDECVDRTIEVVNHIWDLTNGKNEMKSNWKLSCLDAVDTNWSVYCYNSL